MMEPPLFLSHKKATILKVKHKKKILSLLGLFFFLSCSALSRTSTDTRHWLTICTQKATRFDKVSRRSRCCGQAGYSLSFPCFYSFLSCSALPRTSNRSVTLSVWPEYPKIPGTRCACPRMTEEKIILSSPYFYSFLSFPCSFLLLCLFRILFFSSVIPVLGTGI